MKQPKYYHKFDEITGICPICGISKRTTPFVGNGYNFSFKNKFITEYSTDKVVYVKEFINCKPKK